MTIIKCYEELQIFDSFEERFEYLKMGGQVGTSTFGFDRYINQRFYTSYEWKLARNYVITRDNGCDLGISGREIVNYLLIHHMNPVGVGDILHSEDWIFDPEYLITTTRQTHNAIHYGDTSLLPKVVTERTRGDTKLW